MRTSDEWAAAILLAQTACAWRGEPHVAFPPMTLGYLGAGRFRNDPGDHFRPNGQSTGCAFNLRPTEGQRPDLGVGALTAMICAVAASLARIV
ncbi:hypothetical protein QTO30_00380 [Yoonia sp. GPGPB17]|uniref:hypothetical protein n=1 Tax=Yoonia sp. GPGPB17 TaxID=3026147 RepID=UPI0030C34639